MMTGGRAARLLAVLPAFGAGLLWAQTPPLSLDEAVRMALERYPAVRASLEQVSAAAAAINLARTSYLPRADLVGQINRATRNNIFGLAFPQGLPSISGPVLGTNNFTNVWGSAAGLVVSWEPFDFGLRRANVEVAETARARAEAGVAVTRLQVASAAADACLTILAAQQTVRAARAGVDRARAVETAVSAFVNAQLRPGADASRARAERALAETQLAQAERAEAVARASLGQLLGVPAAGVAVEPGRMMASLPAAALPAPAAGAHPLAREQDAAIEEAKAREHALERTWYPRFDVIASAYGRGSGAHMDGTTGGPFSGFGPSVQNWAVGLTASFPLLELPSLHAQRDIEAHRERTERARYDKTVQDLRGQYEEAQAALEGARRIAASTPVQLEAARVAEQQATARYRAALGTVVEVAEAQRLLTQAEIDDALARLGVWRALLAVASAEGDLEPFLQQTR